MKQKRWWKIPFSFNIGLIIRSNIINTFIRDHTQIYIAARSLSETVYKYKQSVQNYLFFTNQVIEYSSSYCISNKLFGIFKLLNKCTLYTSTWMLFVYSKYSIDHLHFRLEPVLKCSHCRQWTRPWKESVVREMCKLVKRLSWTTTKATSILSCAHTHWYVGQFVSAAMSMYSEQVRTSAVHSSQNKISPNVTLISGLGQSTQ